MGNLYLPGTIDQPKKQIATYENGYIRNIHGTCIGRYDKHSIYSGYHTLSTPIATIQYNYGYLRGSTQNFVTAYKSGFLTTTTEKYAAYFDDMDTTGAIAAYIVCYHNNLIPKPVALDTSSATSNSSNTDTCDNIGILSGKSWLWILIGFLFVYAAMRAGVIMWGDFFGTVFRGEGGLYCWPFLIPIIGTLISAIMIYKSQSEYKTLGKIVSMYLIVYCITIIATSLIAGLFEGLIFVLLSPVALVIISWPIFIISITITWLICKK